MQHEQLKSVVVPLSQGECSNKTFRSILTIIENLSYLPGAKQVFIAQLVALGQEMCGACMSDLSEMASLLNANPSESAVYDMHVKLFTPRDSSQAKLLRVLKTIDYLLAKKSVTEDGLMSRFQGHAVWEQLSQTLAQDTEPSVMLPLVECVMIIFKYSMNDSFYAFTEKHRKMLNALVRSNPKLLRGSFQLLIKNPKVLEFDSKRNYFNQQLHQKPAEFRNNLVHVAVRRSHIFQDSYYQLQSKTGNELRYGKLSIKFHEEEGADYGGVSREWYQELTREMFNPNYALFTPSAEKMGVTYQPNTSSWVNPSHLLYFKFVGRVIGKAIYDGRLLDCYFTRSVYKHILGKAVDVSDMEAVDPEYHKSLVWMLENSITDILDLTFSAEHNEFGQVTVIDLKPDGRNIPVTDDNKEEYVKLVVDNRLHNAIKDQITAFLNGFHDIVPKDLVQIFNEKELELLISGIPEIDIDDWKNNTEYRGYTSTSPQVQWFWRAVRAFDQEERAKLLQFITGTSKVPLEGFAHLQGIGGKQKFQIHKDFGKVSRLPSAHTCFNQLDVPVYETFEQLKERLYLSITEGTTGFSFE